MIYLDTSAFIKLYLREEGSREVHGLVVSQADPLPVWSFLELEFQNALRFKVFLGEMGAEDADGIVSLYLDRKRSGQYFTPRLDPIALQELSLRMTARTPAIGCGALDVLHVAVSRMCESKLFITADKRQAALAEAENLTVKLV
jgi:predicted nucleic acid-binding protein